MRSDLKIMLKQHNVAYTKLSVILNCGRFTIIPLIKLCLINYIILVSLK
jgi:hypothetical protein